MTDDKIFDVVNSDLCLIHEKLKELRRSHNVTYAEIGEAIGIKTDSVRNKFSRYDLNTREIIKIIRLFEMRADRFYELVYSNENTETMLTIDQEKKIVADHELLLWVICLLNAMSEDEIKTKYPYFGVKNSNKILRQLDKFGIIDRTAGINNRTTIKPNFKWQKNGPIQNFFLNHAAAEYFETSTFSDLHEDVTCISYFTADTWNLYAQEKLKDLAKDLDTHARILNKKLPYDQKNFMTVVLAIRPFDYSGFDEFRIKNEADIS